MSKKLKEARDGMAETGAAFEALTHSLSPDIIETWKKQEKRALAQRGDSLEIYEVHWKKSSQVPLCPLPFVMLIPWGSTLSGRNTPETDSK